MKEKIERNGYSAEKEVVFLGRVDLEKRDLNLKLELTTQLAEDFGIVKFSKNFVIENGRIVDLFSGDLVSELGNDEENQAIKKIESGLSQDPKKTWVYFSPKNEEFGYLTNSVDFWRKVDEKIVWNRIVVKNDFGDMKKMRSVLGGQEEIKDEKEILKSPTGVNLKLAEIFSLFDLCESKNSLEFDYIEKVVGKYLKEFKNNFGNNLTEDSDVIFRLYSACFNALRNRKDEKEIVISRNKLEDFMYGAMTGAKTEQSFGCSVTTTVGNFGEKIGYYILSNGEVKHGKIPEGFMECKKCGCWYSGEKCPFC
ncbi:MAG: hypothetical protein PHO75_00750 [Candidatus Shapirobacteria bacterium]|jgi:hypothetical protein|nr:hypothetical protein [Candidatus Shapirobacteria bacterium]